MDIKEIWGLESNYKLFISHITKDKLIATKLKKELVKFKISCFVAHEDIEPTSEWLETILHALETANSLIALLTEDFHKSLWTDQEIGYALGRKIMIIPVMAAPYGLISKLQGLKFNEAELHRKIFSILLRKDQNMVNHFIQLINTAERKDFCTDLSEYLKYIKELSEEQVSILVQSFNENPNVNDSYGMRGRTNSSDGMADMLSKVTGRNFEFETTLIIENHYEYKLIEK